MNRVNNIIFITIILPLILFATGCHIGSDGISSGSFFYFDPGPGGGYSCPTSGLPHGSLGVKITHPASYTKAKWDQTIWIYGIVFREGMPVERYPWSGLEWHVDFGKIGESYYYYDQLSPVIWVRFPFDGRVIGPGQHQVKLHAWDNRGGGVYYTEDIIWLIIE